MSDFNSVADSAELPSGSGSGGWRIDLLQAVDLTLLRAQTTLKNAQSKDPIADTGVLHALAQIDAARQHLIDYVDSLPPF